MRVWPSPSTSPTSLAPAAGRSELRSLFDADPLSVDSIDDTDADRLLDLARRSAEVVELLARAGDDDAVDTAAELVNRLLGDFPAQLHLERELEGWRLHHHRVDAPLVAAWSAGVAGAFARVIGERRESRVGACAAADCGRYFYDLSKNRSRRYCSLACQNRTKAAAYRSRKAG